MFEYNNFSLEDFQSLRGEKDYRKTNAVWNNTGINHPKNIGYLIEGIYLCNPSNYEEWRNYFYEKFADKEKIGEYAAYFMDAVFDELSEKAYGKYVLMDFVKWVECRLIYETYLGYEAEKISKGYLWDKLNDGGYNETLYRIESLSPKEDNAFAVDCLVYYGDDLIVGVQIKSTAYFNAYTPIMVKTKAANHAKNEKFTNKYGVPVFYLYYERKADSISMDNVDEISKSIKALVDKAKAC